MVQQEFLKVNNLRKTYRDFVAVDNISFTVNQGEVFGLLGPNGAGKTTTIRMLCGLLKSDSGEITYDGISMSENYQKVKALIGLCPQEIIVWELMTCLEQLKFLGMSYGLSAKKAVDRGEELLQELGLIDKRNKFAKTLSGGMQRRLNIALALIHDPELIILDEPQAGLDPQSRILVRDFIRKLAKKKTVILTTHDMDEADRLSDRVAIVDHGKLLRLDTPAKLKEHNGMSDLLQIQIGEIPQNQINHIFSALTKGFTEKRYSDGYLFLAADDILSEIPVVRSVLESQGQSIENMTIRKRTLEDAFIAMTGRGLRE
jgi:ABC-2 type transport system ATP-binding protein